MLRPPHILSGLRSLGRAARFAGDAPEAGLSLAVIGDIHGTLPALPPLLSRLSTQVDLIVTVGDYIDRGPKSAQVLTLLRAWQAGPGNLVCLAGNHEYMLCRFLDDPLKYAARWLRHGGDRTLESFGVAPPDAPDDGAALVEARDRLRDAMGPRLEEWVRTLPLVWRGGNVVVAHAGADPARPIHKQEPRHLLWGHRDFLTRERADGVWLVHGHWIREAPAVESGRIAVDVGAYKTGRLAAAIVAGGEVSFVESHRSDKEKGTPSYGMPL